MGWMILIKTMSKRTDMNTNLDVIIWIWLDQRNLTEFNDEKRENWWNK